MIHNKENEYRKVLETLSLRFASGNSVPVERSMITRDEHQLMFRLFDDWRRLKEKEGGHQ